jgi:hypothetical protein
VRSSALLRLSTAWRVSRSFYPLCRWHRWSSSRCWSGWQAAGASACSLSCARARKRNVFFLAPRHIQGPKTRAIGSRLSRRSLCASLSFPILPLLRPSKRRSTLSPGQGHCLAHSRPRCHPPPHPPRPRPHQLTRQHCPRHRAARCLCPHPRFLVSSASSRCSLNYGSYYPCTRRRVAARVRNSMRLRSGSFRLRRPRVRLPPTLVAWGTKASQKPLPI